MESEYYRVNNWISHKKTISLCSPQDDLEDELEDYSFEEASIYLNSFTVNQMATLTGSCPSRRLLNSASTLCRRAMISPYCMILGLAYANLYHKKCTRNSLNTFDLFLVSMILSNKFLIDSGEYEAISNREWARLSSRSVQEVNELETEFLNAIEWKLYISPEEFKKFSQEIEAQIVTDLVRRRGYCTYGEILSLFNWEDFNAKFHTSIRNMGIAFLSSFAFYLTGVLAFSVAVKIFSFLPQPTDKGLVSPYNAVEELRGSSMLAETEYTPQVPLHHKEPMPTLPNLTNMSPFSLLFQGHDANRTWTFVGEDFCDIGCVALLSPLDLIDTPLYDKPQIGLLT